MDSERTDRESLSDYLASRRSWDSTIKPLLLAYERATDSTMGRHAASGTPKGTTIVIVTFQSEHSLPGLLLSLQRSTPEPYQVVIVDNGSSDLTLEIARRFSQRYRNVTVIANDDNLGYSYAAQQGVDASSGEILVVLNPDVILTPRWLEGLLSAFDHERVAAAGPLSDYVAGPQNITAWLPEPVAHLDPTKISELTSIVGEQKDVKLLIGFCLALRRSALTSIGGFDRALTLGNDDLDLSWRLQLAGFRLVLVGSVFVSHSGGASFRKLDPICRTQLEQQSLDRFHAKLTEHYDPDPVPTSEDLWGIDILGVASKLKPHSDVWIAIAFDNRIRPDTTGTHCLEALRSIANVVHFLPEECGQIDRSRFDLFLQIDDGTTDYPAFSAMHPSAFWAIDTHLNANQLLSLARSFDAVFCAQKPAVAAFQERGISAVYWLPLAANPSKHRADLQVDEDIDISFVGNPVSSRRKLALQAIHRNFSSSFLGRAFGSQQVEILSRSKVVFNCSVAGDLNMRVFESLATGKPLVTDRLPDESGLGELFTDGEHLVLFDLNTQVDFARNPTLAQETFTKRITELLRDPSRRKAIGNAGQRLVLQRHTYRHRMEQIIRTCVLAPEQGSPGHPSRQPGLTSIVIACCNGAALTRDCLDSILRHTDKSYELILVDNGSTDGTPELLRSWSERAPESYLKGCHVHTNKSNLGFAKANNQGISLCRGEYVLFLNNDVIVTTNWLEGLHRALETVENCGLVGPMSNYAPDDQLVSKIPYSDLAGLDEFALEWSRRHEGSVISTQRVTGFCLLARAVMLDQIGTFDEQFGVGFFEDDDLCRRAQNSGYTLAVAKDVYVHHHGSQTFKTLGIDAKETLRQNHKKFQRKWQTLDSRTSDANPRCSVSLTMIVRDEEENIRDCLQNIMWLFDEVIVLDTGSVDKTKEIASELGASVFEFPWVDDFSRARNEAISHASSDWIFWLDADDRVDDANQQRLHELFRNLPSGRVLAYAMKTECVSRPGGSPTLVDHVRLFPNAPSIRWEYRVHENILPSINRADGSVQWTDVTIQHVGYVDSDLRERKRDRDHSLLLKCLQEHPDDPLVHFNVGHSQLESGDIAGAERHLQRSIDLSEPHYSQVKKAYVLLAEAKARSDDVASALKVIDEARGFFPDSPEILYFSAYYLFELSRLDEAEFFARKILSTRSWPNEFASYDTGILTFRSEYLLARICLASDRFGEAETLLTRIGASHPNYVPAAEETVRILIRSQAWSKLPQALERLRSLDENTADLLEATAAEARGEDEKAKRTYLTVLDRDPVCDRALEGLTNLCVRTDSLSTAEAPLRRRVELEPEGAAGHYNLAGILLLQGRLSDSLESVDAALRYRSQYPAAVSLRSQIVQQLRERTT